MKKIITIFILFFAFSLSSNAQTAVAKETSESKAKQNVFEITKAIDTNGSDAFYNTLFQLFLNKYKSLEKENITVAEKQEISTMVDDKLKATFSEGQIETLKGVPGLYDKLIK
jgi:predicted enzyme related to lactoylglutathione lyase